MSLVSKRSIGCLIIFIITGGLSERISKEEGETEAERDRVSRLLLRPSDPIR